MVDASRIESPADAVFKGSVRSWAAAGVAFSKAGAAPSSAVAYGSVTSVDHQISREC